MFGRTVLAAISLAAASLTAPATLPDAHAAARSAASLSNADDGRAISTAPGDAIRVNLKALRGDGVKWVWDVPAASATDVLARTTGGTAPNGDAKAAFRAEENGRSTITAHRRCVVTAPGRSCPHVVTTWKATVDVR
ncbi:hypothetical protein GCM10010211_83970 [Streptomyces albospinus]|uniref:Proteinase inhibitor I42 chagasin domain-containing protein n=1 Tax=Streptomyces albospinus TaxID=285515 RepID=A0ABQ2VRE0_9ACTN|nr:hypothetical protein [Streptomyces albospinus]GGV03937.1 hypothetical protein GCM10010211_83970 [Streptomyces albospinus]